MLKAIFRFYEELNDFLPELKKKIDFEVEFKERRPVKTFIDDFGIPQTEIDLILLNGKSVDFDILLRDGDRVSVYPVFESLNIKNITVLRKNPLRDLKFIADIDLEDIVQYMRLLGFDICFDLFFTTNEIIEKSENEKRIILTKTPELLKSKGVTHGIWIRPGSTVDQINQIIDGLDIKDLIKPFSRCLCCNDLMENRRTEQTIDNVSSKTGIICGKYLLCKSCNQPNGEKAHFFRVKEMIRCHSQKTFYEFVKK